LENFRNHAAASLWRETTVEEGSQATAFQHKDTLKMKHSAPGYYDNTNRLPIIEELNLQSSETVDY